MAKVNGREYSWGDVTVVMGGRDVARIRGIKYLSKQEAEYLHAKGNKPIGIQKGNISFSGEITILQSELNSLMLLSKSKTLFDLNLNIVVCYGDATKGEPMTIDKIYGAQFTEIDKGLKQGDAFMEVTLPFLCVDIKYNTNL